MSRLHELLIALRDNSLDESCENELADLLADPSHREEIDALLQLDTVLLASAGPYGMQERVQDALHKDMSQQIYDATMQEIEKEASRATIIRFPFLKRSLVLAASMLCALTALYYYQIFTDGASVESASQGVVVLRDGQNVPLEKLQCNDRIQVPASGQLDLALPNESIVQCIGETRLQYIGAKDALFVEQGFVRAQIGKHDADHPFRIASPWGTVEVLGTQFDFMNGADTAWLYLREGAVRWEGAGLATSFALQPQEALLCQKSSSDYLGIIDKDLLDAMSGDIVFEQRFDSCNEGIAYTDSFFELNNSAEGEKILLTAYRISERERGPSLALRYDEPMCAIDENLRLNVTMKLEDVDLVSFGLRNKIEPKDSLSLKYKTQMPTERNGQWQTVSISLSEFIAAKRSDGKVTIKEAPMMEQCHTIVIVAQDSGKMWIDRLWISKEMR